MRLFSHHRGGKANHGSIPPGSPPSPIFTFAGLDPAILFGNPQ
jgi:hypothetical protein